MNKQQILQTPENEYKIFSQSWNAFFEIAIIQYVVNIFYLGITFEKNSLHLPFNTKEKIFSVLILIVVSYIVSVISAFTGNNPFSTILFFTLVFLTFRKIISHKVDKFFNSEKPILRIIFDNWKAKKEMFLSSFDSNDDLCYLAKYEHSAKEIEKYLSSSKEKPPYKSLGFMLEEASRSYRHNVTKKGAINLIKDLDKIDGLKK